MQPTIQDSGLSESGGVLYLRRSGHEQWPWEEMRRWRWWNPRFTRMHHILLDRSWHSIDSTCMIMHAIHALLYSCAKTDQCAKQGSEWRHIHDVTNIWAAERTLNTWHAKPFRIFSTLKALQDMACTCLHFQLQWSFHTKMMGQNPQQPASVCGISMSKCWPTWQFWWLNWPFVLVDITFFPYIFVWGSCFWLRTPVRTASSASSRLLPPTYAHTTTYPQLAHTQLTNTQLSNTQLTHTQLSNTQLTHTQLPDTHTTYSNTHTHNSPTHNLPTRTTYSRSFCVAGVALMALGWLWLRAWLPFGAVVAAAFCVAGVALGDIDLHFAWQALHLVTQSFFMRGMSGTRWHRCCSLKSDVVQLVWLASLFCVECVGSHFSRYAVSVRFDPGTGMFTCFTIDTVTSCCRVQLCHVVRMLCSLLCCYLAGRHFW